jgi:glucosamine--fructose-6-phosphate aminotransferase (isomerizing)
MIENSRRVVFVAAGTSYHASLLGVYFLNRAGIEAHTIIASEFRNFTLLDENTLVIAITQSGETMDVIEALHGIKQKGVKIASLVNVPYSTVQRMSNISINICAGQEICVAATKTFVNQVIALMHLASLFGYGNDIESVPNEIRNLFNDEEKIKYLAKKLKHKKDLYIIGRGMMYPISREIALKLKEIAYIHAEGMMGGELKHGTIALIEEDVPVMGLVDNDEIISNLKEVEARGADVLVISDCDTEFKGFELKASSDAVFSIAATVIGQLLTYYIAKEKCLPIDRPRNLAKSVTVK